LLRGRVVAGVDLQLRAVRGGAVRVVEAFARLRIHQRAVGHGPLLRARVVALPVLHLGAVGRATVADVQTTAERLDGAVRTAVPLLGVVGAAVHQLHLRAVTGAVAGDVRALARDARGQVRGGQRSARIGRRCRGTPAGPRGVGRGAE